MFAGFRSRWIDAGLVRRFQRVGHLSCDRQRLFDRDGAPRETLREIFTLDQLHHERADAGRLFNAIELRDVGMIERGERFRFAFEPHEAIGVRREGLGQDLQRDVAIEARIAGAIHDAHSAFPKRRHDFIRPEPRAGGQVH